MSKTVVLDMRMNDGSMNLADLPEIVSFAVMSNRVRSLGGAEEIGFLTDEVTEMWLDFDYRGHRFSVNNQHGDYWLFVDAPACPEPILFDVLQHFAKINR